jgi:hypothetical protein
MTTLLLFGRFYWLEEGRWQQQRQGQQQIPFGDDNKKSNCNSKMRGSLRCAVHGETVNSFGRDDDAFIGWTLLLVGRRAMATAETRTNSRFPSGMTTREAKATAKAKMRGSLHCIAR